MFQKIRRLKFPVRRRFCHQFDQRNRVCRSDPMCIGLLHGSKPRQRRLLWVMCGRRPCVKC